jgi:hypothetical protein
MASRQKPPEIFYAHCSAGCIYEVMTRPGGKVKRAHRNQATGERCTRPGYVPVNQPGADAPIEGTIAGVWAAGLPPRDLPEHLDELATGEDALDCPRCGAALYWAAGGTALACLHCPDVRELSPNVARRAAAYIAAHAPKLAPVADRAAARAARLTLAEIRADLLDWLAGVEEQLDTRAFPRSLRYLRARRAGIRFTAALGDFRQSITAAGSAGELRGEEREARAYVASLAGWLEQIEELRGELAEVEDDEDQAADVIQGSVDYGQAPPVPAAGRGELSAGGRFWQEYDRQAARAATADGPAPLVSIGAIAQAARQNGNR